MKYAMIYLPVEGELSEECMVITPSGDVMRLRPGSVYGAPAHLRLAAPFVVRYEYNIMHVVGPCPPEAAKWFKSGEDIPSRCVDDLGGGVCDVSCPTCGSSYKQQENG